MTEGQLETRGKEAAAIQINIDVEILNSFFVIREKRRPKFEVVDGEDLLEGTDNILRDQTVRFTTSGCSNPGGYEYIVI